FPAPPFLPPDPTPLPPALVPLPAAPCPGAKRSDVPSVFRPHAGIAQPAAAITKVVAKRPPRESANNPSEARFNARGLRLCSWTFLESASLRRLRFMARSVSRARPATVSHGPPCASPGPPQARTGSRATPPGLSGRSTRRATYRRLEQR